MFDAQFVQFQSDRVSVVVSLDSQVDSNVECR